jgi:adenine/guanine/hypoxanthine permease
MANAMGLVLLEGLVIVLLVLSGVRQAVFHVVPAQLKQAIVVGIGFFILFLGLVSGGIVVKGDGTPLALGDFTSVPVYLTLLGLVVTIVLPARGWRGAVPIGIIATTVPAILINWATSGVLVREGFATIPPSPVAMPDFSLVGAFDLGAFVKLGVLGACVWVCGLMLSDFFDSFGTLVGVAAGGRTGWVGVVVGACFLLAMVFSPVAGMVPPSATAPALVIVGYLMIRTLSEREKLDLRDLSFDLPATMMITLMPLTYSIANGIGAGFLSYVAVRLVRGEWRKVHPLIYVFTALFVLYFLMPLLREWLVV